MDDFFDYETHVFTDEELADLGMLPCSPLPEGFPEDWRQLNFTVFVSLILTEYNCLSRPFFREFRVSSLEDAVDSIVKHNGLCLCYGFYIQGLIPAFAWDFDSPLLRRSSRKPSRRKLVEGPAPGEYHSDDIYFQIRDEPVQTYVGRPYLQVGGRSPEVAFRNWAMCAQVIRRLYRKARQLKENIRHV